MSLIFECFHDEQYTQWHKKALKSTEPENRHTILSFIVLRTAKMFLSLFFPFCFTLSSLPCFPAFCWSVIPISWIYFSHIYIYIYICIYIHIDWKIDSTLCGIPSGYVVSFSVCYSDSVRTSSNTTWRHYWSQCSGMCWCIKLYANSLRQYIYCNVSTAPSRFSLALSWGSLLGL